MSRGVSFLKVFLGVFLAWFFLWGGMVVFNRFPYLIPDRLTPIFSPLTDLSLLLISLVHFIALGIAFFLIGSKTGG